MAVLMVSKEKIHEILSGYDRKQLTLATICSHSSLQIFHGAKHENFRTLGITLKRIPRYYEAFPRAKPDEFLVVDRYEDVLSNVKTLQDKNVIIVPHGSFVEYLGTKAFEQLELPTFGNRRVLDWEYNREKTRYWLEYANVPMPKKISKPEEIDRPVIVKYYGAKGGKGFFIAKNYDEFSEFKPTGNYTIQEYVLGTRYYMHFFYSPISNDGYTLSKGTLQLLSMDRRDEANIDEMYKLGAQEKLRVANIYPSFVVTGNVPVVLRESLLPSAFDIAERVVESSIKLFGGMIGPFCIESIVMDNLEFRVFEISTRIVAGTNLFISGSPYSDLVEDNLSTGRRIAREIKLGVAKNLLTEIIS